MQKWCVFFQSMVTSVLSKDEHYNQLHQKIKSDSPTSEKKNVSFDDSLLKIIKNDFYFILKALFILKIFKSSLTFWLCKKNQLD